MVTTAEIVYDTLKAVVIAAGLEFAGRILENEQTPATSRRRAFWLIPQGEAPATGMVSQGRGYRWTDEAYTVRLSHTFKGKRQETARALAYSDAGLVWDAIENALSLLALSPSVFVTGRGGPALSSSGDFIVTDLEVSIRYQLAQTAVLS